MSCPEVTNPTLQFNSVTIGDFVASFTSGIQLVEEVRARHNYWAGSALIDAGYPALIYHHQFAVYISKDSRALFADWYYDLGDNFALEEKSLKLQVSGADVIDFGTCALSQHGGLQDPDSLFHHTAGVVNLMFIGTTKPVVTT